MDLLLPDGQRIRYLRENRKNYSQAGLAEAAHCSLGTIMRIEKGLATNPGTLVRVAKALGVDLAELARSKDWTRDLLSNHQIAAVLDRIRPAEPQGMCTRDVRSTLPLDVRGHGVLSLLRSLGIIELEGQEWRAVSEIADAFLASLRTFLSEDGKSYPGQWNASTVSASGRKLTSLIRTGEEHRIQTSPAPARMVQAALGVIRADFGKEPRFLMLHEPTWKPEGAWWFLGGIEKPCDAANLAVTMLREIREELAVEAASLRVQCLGHARDLRISGRLGLFTRYEYHVFQVQGDHCPELQKLLVPHPTVEVYAPQNPSFSRIHKFAWFSWNQLLQTEHLAKNAAPVLSLLSKLDPFKFPSLGKLPRTKERLRAGAGL